MSVWIVLTYTIFASNGVMVDKDLSSIQIVKTVDQCAAIERQSRPSQDRTFKPVDLWKAKKNFSYSVVHCYPVEIPKP